MLPRLVGKSQRPRHQRRCLARLIGIGRNHIFRRRRAALVGRDPVAETVLAESLRIRTRVEKAEIALEDGIRLLQDALIGAIAVRFQATTQSAESHTGPCPSAIPSRRTNDGRQITVRFLGVGEVRGHFS